MRFWYQSMTDLERYPMYRATIEARAVAILDDVDVDAHGVAPGTYGDHAPVTVLTFPVMHHRLLSQVIDNARRAEAEGYDAVVLGSWSEPHLREIRSVVDIPVSSMAEATLLTGCSVAGRVGLVTVTASLGEMARRIISSHHLADRVAGIEVLQPEVDEDELAAGFDQPDAMVRRFVDAAERVIDRGADVVIPAEGVLSELLAQAGLRRVGQVSVMDSVAVTMLHARMMVSLQQGTGLSVGRRWAYRKPDQDVLQLLDSEPRRT